MCRVNSMISLIVLYAAARQQPDAARQQLDMAESVEPPSLHRPSSAEEDASVQSIRGRREQDLAPESEDASHAGAVEGN